MKGIVLAGGAGTRLHPTTMGVSKHLLPIYDKPMIYYPLSVLMLAGIKDILVITTPEDSQNFKNILGTGDHFGIHLSYAIQAEPNGLAEAFILAEEFIAGDNVCLILGDNLFFGQGFSPLLEKAVNTTVSEGGAVVFAYPVKDPQRFGVLEFNKHNKVVSLEEKPENPRSNYAVTGLYFYDSSVVEKAKTLSPSARGELEITDINKLYLQENRLNVQIFGRGFAWLDAGTHDSLIEAGQFVQTIEKRQGFKIACLEEIAFYKGWLNKANLQAASERLKKTGYGEYLTSLIEQANRYIN